MDICKWLMATALLAMAMGGASATPVAIPGHGPGGVVAPALPEADRARRQILDFEMAPIKTSGDLAAYLRSANRGSPLMALSPGGRQRFLDSLTFNENGLVSYRYEDLAQELTASQAYRVLSLFGAQRTTHLLHARVETSDAAVMSARTGQ